MSYAKSIAFAAALALTIHAYAGSNAQGPHGGIAAARGLAASRAASHASASAQSGQGGRYQESVVDNYQPWPQSEMKQYAKAKWEPYAGN